MAAIAGEAGGRLAAQNDIGVAETGGGDDAAVPFPIGVFERPADHAGGLGEEGCFAVQFECEVAGVEVEIAGEDGDFDDDVGLEDERRRGRERCGPGSRRRG